MRRNNKRSQQTSVSTPSERDYAGTAYINLLCAVYPNTTEDTRSECLSIAVNDLCSSYNSALGEIVASVRQGNTPLSACHAIIDELKQTYDFQ